MTEVLYAVEGTTDAPVAEKLIRLMNRVPRQVSASGGSSTIDTKLARWAQSSNSAPMLILRDWDPVDHAACPAELVGRIAGVNRPPNIAVRIVVRSIESWLMADIEAAKDFFRTPGLPATPESLHRPKPALARACEGSRLARVKRGMVPRQGSGGAVGPEYTLLVTEFARDHWDPLRASENSPSLARTVQRLRQLVESGVW